MCTVRNIRGLTILLTICLGLQRFGLGEDKASGDKSASPPSATAGEQNRGSSETAPLVRQLTGVVLSPEGKPAAGAQIVIFGKEFRGRFSAGWHEPKSEVIAQGTCNAQGEFRLERFKSTTAATATWQLARVMVCAKGYALASRSIDLYEEQTLPIKFTLPVAQQLRGRLLSADGKPAANIPVKITEFFEAGSNGDSALPTRALDDADLPKGFYHFTLKTDAGGQLSLDHVPPGFIVWLSVNSPPFAEQRWPWLANSLNPKMVPDDVVLTAGKIINGRVIAADTGKPLANAGLMARAQNSRWLLNTESDAQGRFQFNTPQDATFDIEAYAPIGTPYLGHKQNINPGDDLAPEVQIALPRGVLVRGKVVEQFTGRPVPFAGIGYLAHADNPNVKEIEWQQIGYPLATADETGSFVLGIPPGKGNLLVSCASADYVLHKFSKDLLLGKPVPDLTSQSAFANQPLDVPLGAGEISVELSLERGVTVQGNVVGADGAIPQQMDVYCRAAAGLRTDATTSLNQSWPNFNGHLKVRGIPVSGDVLVFLFDRASNQGKALQLKGSDAEKPYNMRLDKCATATLRFIDAHGDPVPGYMPMSSISLLWLPSEVLAGNSSSEDLITLETTIQSSIDNASRKLVSNETGRVTIPNLIPGAIYKLNLPPTKGVPREIKLRPGENLELPPIVISDASAVGRAKEVWKAKQAAEANQK